MGVEQLKLLYIAGGSVKRHGHFEKLFIMKLNIFIILTMFDRTPRYLLKIKENIRLQNDLYINIHSSFTHNNENLETTVPQKMNG